MFLSEVVKAQKLSDMFTRDNYNVLVPAFLPSTSVQIMVAAFVI
jgi:hypothetical protein